MCILFIHSDPNPTAGGYRLIIASNRDEYYKRPAKSAYLCAETNIIGGRDMEVGREGGMWLGLTANPQTGRLRFGALLNLTGEVKQAGAHGRGTIVHDYLTFDGDGALPAFARTRLTGAAVHTAYNLVGVELTKRDGGGGGDVTTYHYSNTPVACSTYAGKQTLAFGNSTTQVPLSKVIHGRGMFEKIVDGGFGDRDDLVARLLDLLKYSHRHLPDVELERRSPVAFEFLSSIFVKIENVGYGTRTHSIILVDYDWNVDFIEHTMKEPIDMNDPQWAVSRIKSSL